MTAGVYAEIAADRKHLVVAVAGTDWELDQAAAALHRLTPLGKKTKPPGMLYFPLTWSAVTQLGHTFTGSEMTGKWIPGPRLREWTQDEFIRRHTVQPPCPDLAPAELTPRPYQLEGASQIGFSSGFLLFDEPGPQPAVTPVWTPDGWRALGELQPGDIVCDSNGRPAPVVTVKHSGEQPVYRVTFSDRTSTLATGSHRWRVWTRNDRKRGTGGRIMSTSQILAAGLRLADGARNFYLPQQPVITGTVSELPLDPYAYGALLGDGSLGSESTGITCPDNEILVSVAGAVTALGTTWRWNTPAGRCQNLVFHRNGKLRTVLNELGAMTCSADKAVAPGYLQADVPARRALLAGLLDTDGCVTKTGAGIEFSSASAQLAADVAWLARSLGAVVTEAAPQRAGYVKDGRKTRTQDKHRLHIRFPADGLNPFTLPRKADEWARQAIRVQRRNPPRLFDAIEPAGTADVCCIGLGAGSTHVYLTDTALIPTHNTGKTVTAVLGLLTRRARGLDIFPMLIVVPSWDVADVWDVHIAAWAPGWPDPVLYGGAGRSLDNRWADDLIAITTYDTARIDAETLVKLKPATVVLDEAHYVKNEHAKRTNAVKAIARHAGTLLALTGTPVTRDTGDIFPVLQAMDPASYPDRQRFAKRYLQTSGNGYEEKIEGLAPDREPEFRTVLAGQYRRVAKADVLDQLPPKIYSVRRVVLPAEWRTAYDTMEHDMLAELPDGGELPVMSVLAQLTRLSQLASSACDVLVTEEPDEQGGLRKHYEVTLKAPSWKADTLLGVLAERPGQPVAVFANSRQLIDIAGEACMTAGYKCGFITGTVPKKPRQAFIEEFQAGHLDVILATAGAGGLGITLTAAGTAVFLQRSWELDKALQPEDRLHRIGQQHDAVEIIDITGKDTVDDRVRELMRVKGGQLGQLVKDPRIVRELLGGLK